MKPLLVLLLTLVSAVAVEPEAKKFTPKDGPEVLYRYSAPAKLESGKKYPLVLFLHGAGERGNDNEAQLKHGVNAILQNTEKLGQPIFLIAPQCPKDARWEDANKRPTNPKDPRSLLDHILSLVEETTKQQAVDPKRIYITGLSMGGFGTWSALAKEPDLFAAAIPICGGGSPDTVKEFKDVPIWIFHGDADNVVAPAGSQNMFDALKKAGSEAKLTLYPGVGHNSWTQTYSDIEVIRWFLAQQKSK
ncbi:MAG: prolyl oligopeptidase family serine peptidase [Verrucomicrobiota bacterium]